MSFELQKHESVFYSHHFTHEKKLKIQKDLPATQSVFNSKTYALKKRLLVPMWWVEGLLLSLGTKEVWFDSLISKRLGKTIAVPSNINAKNITLMFSIWHEVLNHIFLSQKHENDLNLKINKYLTGTQSEILEQSKQLEDLWILPFKLFEIKPSKKTKSFSLSKTGSTNLIRHAQIRCEVDGIWLSLDLSQSMKEFCFSRTTSSNASAINTSFMSINPVVIQSMGKRANLKKILNYLFFEFSKQDPLDTQSHWNSIYIDSKNLCSFHKNLLSHGSSLYDHGILGWQIGAPNMKISDLRKKIPSFLNHANENSNALVYCWPLSEQAKEARELESELSSKFMPLSAKNVAKGLFPEPPPDELKKIRMQKVKNNILLDISSSQNMSSAKNADLSDNDFIILLSEFYESLKPLQKKSFERERSNMTPEQFRAYITPVLKRKRESHFARKVSI